MIALERLMQFFQFFVSLFQDFFSGIANLFGGNVADTDAE